MLILRMLIAAAGQTSPGYVQYNPKGRDAYFADDALEDNAYFGDVQSRDAYSKLAVSRDLLSFFSWIEHIWAPDKQVKMVSLKIRIRGDIRAWNKWLRAG